ncbi:hypothetical protein ACJRO7_013366 [Eucalyptus globulus]|uniref:RING-type E3 ubiquitin transferase n=1 Tax=Eucalyptus globulus TaxID=34317 RepID=A0ABD3L0P1_EUCGL
MPPHHGALHGGGPASGHRHGGGSLPSPPPPKQNPKLLSLLLKAIIMILITTLFFLFLGLAAIILLLLCLAGGLLHRRHQIDLPPPPGGALPPRDLKRLPKFRFPKSGAQGQGLHDQGFSDCAVCLDEFSQGQWCRKLVGCGHVFHKSCVDTWLVKVAACPVCRSPVRAQVGSTGPGIDGRDCKQLWAFGRETPI